MKTLRFVKKMTILLAIIAQLCVLFTWLQYVYESAVRFLRAVICNN